MVFNVLDYGAIPDGQAWCWKAFKDWSEAITAARGGVGFFHYFTGGVHGLGVAPGVGVGGGVSKSGRSSASPVASRIWASRY